MNLDETKELMSRVRRIETRLMRMGELLGVDPSHRVHPVVDHAENSINLKGLDYSIGNLIDLMEKEGISNLGPVRLRLNGVTFGYFERGDE